MGKEKKNGSPAVLNSINRRPPPKFQLFCMAYDIDGLVNVEAKERQG
jgi:hypothetical protein